MGMRMGTSLSLHCEAGRPVHKEEDYELTTMNVLLEDWFATACGCNILLQRHDTPRLVCTVHIAPQSNKSSDPSFGSRNVNLEHLFTFDEPSLLST